ncbi:MAG: type II secretion system protein [Proteobacteria bacterium]|nr:type II secretion system protein [Pseudomonadota bacterium]
MSTLLLRRRGPRGVVLLALLIALTLLGIGLMAASDVWALARQREQERQLLFAGTQYRDAILRYYHAAPPGTPKVLPRGIKDLLDDDRFPMPVHHLRRAYADPMGGDDWGELRIAGRLAGVYSRSERAPVKLKGFAPGFEPFEGRASYREWVFAVSPQGQPTYVNPDALQPPGTARRTPS